MTFAEHCMELKLLIIQSPYNLSTVIRNLKLSHIVVVCCKGVSCTHIATVDRSATTVKVLIDQRNINLDP